MSPLMGPPVTPPNHLRVGRRDLFVKNVELGHIVTNLGVGVWGG